MTGFAVYLLFDDTNSRGISLYWERLLPSSANLGPMPIAFCSGITLMTSGIVTLTRASLGKS